MKNTTNPLKIPARLLAPIKEFLGSQLRVLERRRQTLEKDDPFVLGRAENTASPDTGAAEHFGHDMVEAVRKELEKRISQIKKAVDRIDQGKYGVCERCEEMIDTDRLGIYPEATLCVKCERRKEGRK